MRIRPATTDDAPLLRQWLDTYLGAAELAWRRPNNSLPMHLGIIEAEGEPVGGADLYNVDLDNLSAEIGVYVLPEHRKKGYGMLAARRMMQRGFERLGLERIEAQTLSTDAELYKAMERAGFIKEGARRRAAVVDGEHRHVVVWSMLKTEFEAAKKR